ncbi:SpoIIE family protein phosphatase [uncultured Microscilla sp.]|uniref:PP2C family protein-serine/threonine phosphatase n=1 Tax=uncultured Microscilla sp. TaxID=432653 RepID=UPI0026264D0B|nr:SpoIIE family protein phosphatase [uncultured Microscilla sp.]
MPKNSNWFNQVFNIGVSPENQDIVNRKIQLSNAFAFFHHLAGYILGYFFYKLSGQLDVLIFINIANCTILVVLLLNYFKKYLAAKLYLIVILSFIFVFFSNLLGPSTDIHFFLILLIGLAIMLFTRQEKKYTQIAFFIPFIAFAILESSICSLLMKPLVLPAEALQYIRWVVVVVVFGLFTAMVWIFSENLQKAQEQAQVLLYETVEQNEALETQGEELRQNLEELLTTQEILGEKNQLLKRKNDLITSSITYAQTIQKAVLPTVEDINQVFNEWFIIHRPKDIVSGDFYWMSYIENKVFIAVVDCTGHGVPGAFMSMVGSTLLNEIVNEERIFDVNKVLEVLHFKVKKALRQQSGHNQDGMDVCLCRLDYQPDGNDQQVALQYAGAKRPLFYLTNGEFHKFKGDKQSIAGWSKDNRCFIKQEAILQKNDCIYLSTDGFVDTPSPQRKSLGNRRFEQMLKQQSQYSMTKQKDFFAQMLVNHQQDADQRDDVTLFGIKV